MDREPTGHKKPVFPSFSQDDIKLLVITFAGTVAANVITVIFIGLAIAIKHAFLVGHGPSSYILWIGITVLTIAELVWIVHLARGLKRKFPHGLRARAMISIAIPVAGLLLILVLLWVGVAAGIK